MEISISIIAVCSDTKNISTLDLHIFFWKTLSCFIIVIWKQLEITLYHFYF